MNDGRIEMDGTPKEVFSNVEKLRAIELDVPQITDLGHRLRKAGMDIPEGILTEEEAIEAIKKLAKRGKSI